MYNIKDIQSVGVFKWELKSNGKEMKKSKAIVRVKGLVTEKEKVFEVAENVVGALDSGSWSGKKSITVK